LQARTGLTWADRTAQVRSLIDAGVTLISGDDAGINPVKRHGILPMAIADLVEIGMSVPQALASATGVAARAIGLAQRTGRLHAGLAADLLLVDGDAVRDVSALQRVRTVVLRGAEVA
jgi:imidazolonepropionase-like amidohydrolase